MLRTWSFAEALRPARGVTARWPMALLPVLATLAVVMPARARELWADDFGDRYVTLNSALKPTLLVGEQAGSSGAQATNFWRLRFDLEAVPEPWLQSELSYEHRLMLESTPLPMGGGARWLPPTGDFPYQLVPLGGAILDEPGLRHEHSFDRAAVGIRGDWGQVKLGRQAIGFGRAMFFTATDVLAPFGTVQVDQEWKTGVDALDAELQVADTASIGLTGAAERDLRDGALLARAQGYLGDVDAALLGGKRSQDWMLGLAASAQLFDAAVSGELAYFATDGSGVPHGQVGSDGVIKAVAGGSYAFDVLAGLALTLEYHYNGFGIRDVQEDASLTQDPAWLARVGRGDFQTLGRHELATALSLTIDENLSATGYAIVSPIDGSGLASLGGTWSYANHLSLDLNAFAPWGKGLDTGAGAGGPALGSEYGATPITVYLAMRMYD